ncbi:hypothetical protein M3Y99_00296100 [Aphelenchoides fujianensis]|nr:hypothetical protein M3Y99_00296100 [Aphelenchoides fujianensis]
MTPTNENAGEEKPEEKKQTELPLVYQLRQPHKSGGVERAAAGEDSLLESRTTPFNSFICSRPEKFRWSADGRFFYAVWKDRRLVVLDLVLNTQKEFTSKSPFSGDIQDFVVVDPLTVVANTWEGLYLFRLNDEAATFESIKLELPDPFRWHTSTLVFTEILGTSGELKRAVLEDGLGEVFVVARLDVRKGRVHVEADGFLEIGMYDTWAAYHLSEDGRFFYSLNWRYPGGLSTERPSSTLSWSKKHAYFWTFNPSDPTHRWLVYRCDFARLRWEKLPIRPTELHWVSAITNEESGEDEGLLLLCLPRRGQPEVHRRLFKTPDSLVHLAVDALRRHNLDVVGKEEFHAVISQPPFKDLFPPLYANMQPIPRRFE